MPKKETENQYQPFNLKGEIFSIEILDKEIGEQKKRALRESNMLQGLEKQKSEKLDIIKDKIRGGEASTGNQIKDFTIVFFEDSEEKEKQLLDLEKGLSQHKGEFVLLKNIESETNRWIDLNLKREPKPHPELWHWAEKAYIGVISEKKPLDLDMEKGRIVITSEKLCYINLSQFPKLLPIDFKNNSILIPYYELTKLNKSVESAYSKMSSLFPSLPSIDLEEIQINSRGVKDIAMEILVGDEKVFGYLKKEFPPEAYPLVVKRLGQELKNSFLESEKVLLERKKEVD